MTIHDACSAAISVMWVTLASGCAFDPAQLAGGAGTPDASLEPVDATSATVDVATIDQMRADAQRDVCPGGSTLIPLGTAYATYTIPTGRTSAFTPSCSESIDTGSELYFHVDVTGETGADDLVVDVDDSGQDGLDSVIDITRSCANEAGEVCEDAASIYGGEVAVIPHVTNGRYYIIIDSYDNTDGGAFKLRAFIRPVKTAAGAACDPLLVNSRCGLGLDCVQSINGASTTVNTCTALNVVDDAGNNDDACTTAQDYAPVTGDSIFVGAIDNDLDEDWIQLAPAADSAARITLYTPNGGCNLDLVVEMYSGSTCVGGPVSGDSDDNSGLGPCPSLSIPKIDHSKMSFLRISTAVGATLGDQTSYTAVIDFMPQAGR